MAENHTQPAILLVGLDPSYRSALEEQLTSLAWRSMSVQNGNEFRKVLNRDGFDIILFNADGVTAEERPLFDEVLGKAAKDISPSLMVTGDAKTSQTSFPHCSLASYIPKPKTPQGYLAPMIREILLRSRGQAKA